MTAEAPVSSEATSLLLLRRGGNNSSSSRGGSSNGSQLAVEPGSWDNIHQEEEDADADEDEEHQRQRQRRIDSSSPSHSSYSSYRKAMTAILAVLFVTAFAMASLLHLALVGAHPMSNSNSNSNDQQSLFDSSSSTSSLNYWNDAIHYKWEEFLMTNTDNADGSGSGNSMYYLHSLSSSAAATSLFVPKEETEPTTTTTTTTKVDRGEQFLYFNESRAFSLLNANDDFFHYQNGWEAQMTQTYCAVATTAAALNSLRDVSTTTFELPMDPIYDPFPWATQSTVIDAKNNECVRHALGGEDNADAVKHIGLGLVMIPKLANCYLEPNGYVAEAYHADDRFQESYLKQIVVDALMDPQSRVLLNYDRGGIGQGPLGHGHWSPLGGYNAEKDMFLIMDVAKYKHPMVWVKWKNLFGGVTTKDTCSEMLPMTTPIDWNTNFKTKGYFSLIQPKIDSICIPGNRGFVVVKPTE